jgi:LysM repeat protein
MKKKVAAITTVVLLSSTFSTSAFASTYQVQKGDTLTHIAKKHNTSVSKIKNLNKLKTDFLYVNQVLKVSASTTNKPSSTQTSVKPVTSKPSSTVAAYTVTAGDTLGKIASKHNLSLTKLMELNNLDNYIIYPGQKLKVSSSVTTEKDNTASPADEAKPEEPANANSYVVHAGDTLGKISSRYGMTISELKKLNSLTSDTIYVGQKLKVLGTATPENKEEPASSDATNELVKKAKDWIGTPYSWGGISLDGFDCSGFIYYAFNAVGEKISRQSTDGYFSRSYYVDTPVVGDLVFFVNTYKSGISHMGIYLGNDQFIHASTSKGVTISSLNEAYYQQRFDGFKRFY